MTREVCDRGEAANEADVEEHGEECEEPHAAKAKSKEDAEDGVETGRTGHALNGLFPRWNGNVMFGQNGKVVAVDAQDDGSASELEDAKACLAEAQDCTSEGHG